MSAPDELIGKQAKCPKCRTVLAVPLAALGAAPDEPAVTPARAKTIQPPLVPPAVDRSTDSPIRPRASSLRSSGDDGYDDIPRPRCTRPRDDYDEEDHDRRPRRGRDDARRGSGGRTEASILGIISLIKGVGGLVVSLIPFIGSIAIFPGVIGLILGIIGIVVAKKSGRQGTGLPIAGTVVSGLCVLISSVWLIVGTVLFGDGESSHGEGNTEIVDTVGSPFEEKNKPGPVVGGQNPAGDDRSRPVPDGQPVSVAAKPRVVEAPSSGVSSLAVSPDGLQFAVRVAVGEFLTEAWEIQLWDFASGRMDRVLHKLEGDDEPGAMTYSPDGRTLAVASITGVVRLYDLPGGKLRKTLSTNGRPKTLRYSANGKLLVWSSSQVSRPNRVIAWDTESGSEVLNFTVPENKKLELARGGADVTADGKTVFIPYVGDWSNKDDVAYLTFWNLPGTEPARTVPLKKKVHWARLAPDGKTVVLVGFSTLELCDAATMKPIKTFDHGLWGMWFSPDGRVLAGMHGRKQIMFVDLDTFARRVVNVPAAWAEVFFSTAGDRFVCMTSPTQDEPEPSKFLIYDFGGVK